MNILGITNDDLSSAVLFYNGVLVAAVSEERFTRKRMDETFPTKSIEFVLSYANINYEQIDVVSYAWSKGFPEDVIDSHLIRFSSLGSDSEKQIFLERIRVDQSRDLAKRNEFWQYIEKEERLSNAVIEDYYHHEAHALSACLMSPFEDCAVLTCDGRGDYESLTFSIYDQKTHLLRKLYSSSSVDSLGFFYGRITGLLGFTPHRHEGKITGLAAYGDSANAKSLMNKMIIYDGENIKANLGAYYRPFYTNYSEELVSEISTLSKVDVAAAAQSHIEDILAKFIEDMYNKYNLNGTPLCLGGGVFSNVKINARLRDTKGVNGIFVQPQMGDGGLAIGAACGSLNRRNIRPAVAKSMSLGPHGGLIGDVKSAAAKDGFIVKELRSDQLIDRIVNEIVANRVVGLVRGRMEFGPRALCNRSIIYKSSDTTCNDWLNKRMDRTEFMPFAPVMTEENASLYIKGYREDDMSLWFMTATVDVSDQFKEKSPAVTHVDQTARPQVVSKGRDPWLWKLLNAWHQKTGEPSLINTSFNKHEHPIVCSYKEAYLHLVNNVIDVLVLDNFMIGPKDE